MTRDARRGLSWLPFLQSPGRLRRAKPAGASERAAGKRPPQPQIVAVEVEGVTHEVRVQRHRRARRYTLRIHATRREAILSMPLRGNLTDARDFAHRHAGWLAERLRKLPEAMLLADGARLPLRGQPCRIVHRATARGTVWLEQTESGEALICVAGDAAHTARRVKDYLKREARRALTTASRRYADTLGVKIARVGIRDQSSRWGSCNSDGVLSYSWRLILAPPYVLDYLAAHEVAHLVEMNHSPRFWRVVMRICPETDRAKAWLTAHGNDLHRYGAG